MDPVIFLHVGLSAMVFVKQYQRSFSVRVCLFLLPAVLSVCLSCWSD